MQTTMNLLHEDLQLKDMGQWTKELELSGKALYNAKYREHLSPAIAGSIADKLGKDVRQWIMIAALESERDSACKTHMLRKITTL